MTILTPVNDGVSGNAPYSRYCGVIGLLGVVGADPMFCGLSNNRDESFVEYRDRKTLGPRLNSASSSDSVLALLIRYPVDTLVT